MTKRESRSRAEWVTFAISCIVLAGVVSLIGVQMVGTEEPAAPAVSRVGEARQVNGLYYVTVEVSNAGDVTATDVQVSAELTIGEETTTGDQVIDFLAGDEVEEVAFVFTDDPTTGELTIQVSGFSLP